MGARNHLQRPRPPDVSALLRAWSEGDSQALAKLTPIVYEELRRLARAQMRRERPDHTLETTALVNEAYLRLIECQRIRWQDRAHFFAISAKLMRRILIDYARRRNLKRGAEFQHVSLDEAGMHAISPDPDLIALDEALQALEQFDPRKAKVVELRFFGGLSVEQTAEVLNVSTITVTRDWNLARTWLYCELAKERPTCSAATKLDGR